MIISELSGLKILVVDDDIASCAFIGEILDVHGFTAVEIINDPREVLASVLARKPDLVLLDVVMPHLDGFAVLRQIRSQLSPDEYLPIVIITSSDDTEIQHQALLEGAADFLPKPLRRIEVVLRIFNLLRARWQYLQSEARNERLNHEVEAHRNSLEELNATTARLSTLLENLQSGVLVEDADRRIVLANPQFCAMFGEDLEPSALIGRDYAEACDQYKSFFADSEAFVCETEAILAAREVVNNQELTLKDGRVFERDYVPIFQKGNFLGHLWAHRDITSRKHVEEELRASEARKAAILQSALDCIITINHEGMIVEFNPAAERMFGYDRDQILGQQFIDIIVPKSLRSAHQAGFHRQVTTGVKTILGERVEVPALHADGHEFPIEIAVTRIDTKDGPMFTGYLRDISERKRFEHELAEARDAALESARLKAEFLANMSHEIRTPINGVLGMLDLLADSSLDSDQHSLLQTAQSSAGALLNIINDVLDLSKIEAGKLVIEDGIYSPRQIVENCVLMVAGAANEKGLDIVPIVDATTPARVRGDGHRVRQILTNFLANAVKFTERGEIVIHVAYDPPASLRYMVSDTGPGIAPEIIKRLFQPFVQADGSMTRRYGGTGLGLAISKQLIELMDGDIGVQSEVGKGSQFWITLPMRILSEDETSPDTERIVPESLQRARLLVVEDNAAARDMLLQQIQSWHIAAVGAGTGNDALQKLRAATQSGETFDAILLDAQLPADETGALVCEIKSDPALNSTRLLLMTALNSRQEIGSEFAATLSKPVRASQLFDALIEALQKSGESDHANFTARASQKQSTPAEPIALPLTSVGKGVRVLVADDNAINREVALRWLQKWGYEVQPVVNGKEALQAVQLNSFDLVLMDCQMPEMDGYEATAAIRRLGDDKKQIPIIALTAHALEGDREKCLEAGMDDYMPKPIRPALLYETVSRWQDVSITSLKNGETLESNQNKNQQINIHDTFGEDQNEDHNEDNVEANWSSLDLDTLAELLSLFGDQQLQSVVADFVAQSKDYLAPIQVAINQRDGAALSRAAHTYKGAARQMGAAELAVCCEEMESHAHNCDFQNAHDQLNRLHDEAQRANCALQHWCVAPARDENA